MRWRLAVTVALAAETGIASFDTVSAVDKQRVKNSAGLVDDGDVAENRYVHVTARVHGQFLVQIWALRNGEEQHVLHADPVVLVRDAGLRKCPDLADLEKQENDAQKRSDLLVDFHYHHLG